MEGGDVVAEKTGNNIRNQQCLNTLECRDAVDTPEMHVQTSIFWGVYEK